MSAQTDIQYFKEYRNKWGFSSKDQPKNFLSGEDISPEVDYIYIE